MKKNRRKRFLEELQELPNISIACKKAGISRNTVYRWMEENKKFKSQIEIAQVMGTNSICDLAESKLIAHINNGNMKAIQLYLSSHKQAYFRPRIKEDPLYGGVSEITYTIVNSRNELEELRKLKKEIEEMRETDAEKE